VLDPKIDGEDLFVVESPNLKGLDVEPKRDVVVVVEVCSGGLKKDGFWDGTPNKDCVEVPLEELEALDPAKEGNPKGWTPALGWEKREVDVVEGVEETPDVENDDDCAPCVGGFPKGEETGIENKFDGNGLEVDELDNDSVLEAAEASSFSFCILIYVDLYDSKIPDMSAKGSSSIPLEMELRREWFNPRRLI
jgi:hypothetical protein